MSGTEAYYSFDYGNIHFVILDSSDSPRTAGSPMLLWLAADLATTTQDWIIAFWHSFAVLGSVVLDIDGNQEDVQFLDSTGVVLDHFTMIKGP